MKKYGILLLLVSPLLLTACSNNDTSSTKPSAMQSGEAYARAKLYLQQGNIAKAKQAYLIGAKNGHTDSQVMLATLLLNDKNNHHKQRLEDAYHWLQQPLAQKDPLAIYDMYRYYQQKQDVANSKIWLQKAVAAQFPAAYYEQAIQLRKAKAPDAKVEASLRQAALRNHFPSQAALAAYYFTHGNKVQSAVWDALYYQNPAFKNSVSVQKNSGLINQLTDKLRTSMTDAEKAMAQKEIQKVQAEMAKLPPQKSYF